MSSQRKMWESFRAEVKRRDHDLDEKLSKLEPAAHSCDSASFPSFARNHEEAAEELRALRRGVASMSDIVDAVMALPGAATDAAVMQRATQRFEDVCIDKELSLKRIFAEATKRKESSELLRNVHREIEIFDDSAEMRHLANENDSLRHTQRQTRHLLEQAEMNKGKLRAQREMFERISGRALSIAEQLPVIKDLLKRIDAKRRRDAVVVGIVIAICLLLVFVFW